MEEQPLLEREEKIALKVCIFRVKSENFVARIGYHPEHDLEVVRREFPKAECDFVIAVPLKDWVKAPDQASAPTFEGPKALMGAIGVALEDYGEDMPEELRDGLKKFVQEKFGEL